MNKLLLALAVSLLAGCAGGPPINNDYVSRNQDSRAQFLIIHFTSEGFGSSLRELTVGKVSSHYLVNDNPPTIYRLVDESRRAFHAGVSSWKGQTQLNAASIGIEIVNLGNRDSPDGTQYQEYRPEQIEAVMQLVRKIIKEHQIRPDRVLGHSDIAPQRKVDPGPKFPWKRLADEGLIIWPDPLEVALRLPGFQQQMPDVLWFQSKLAEHGFGIAVNGQLDAPTRRVMAAFQMKYRPAKFDGEPDAETAAMLDVLTSPATAPSPPTPPAPPAPPQPTASPTPVPPAK